MVQTVIRWQLKEVMARHGVKAKDFAAALKTRPSTISDLRNYETMPKIDGTRLNQFCMALSRLSKRGEIVKPSDLLEFVPDPLPSEGTES